MEADDVSGLADVLDRHRLEDEPTHAPRVERGGDDAGAAVIIGEVRVYVGLADYQAADARLERRVDYLRLVAADDDAARLRELRVAVGLRQGEHDVARDGLDVAAELVYELPLKHTQEVEHRQRLDVRVVNGLHIIGRDVSGGEHPVQGAVIAHDGDRGDLAFAHDAPRQIHRHAAVQLRRSVKLDVAYLCAHGLDEHRRLKPEAVEHGAGFVVYRADAYRLVLTVAQSVAQVGIGHRRDYRVGVRIAVTCYIYIIQREIPPF